MNNIRIDDSSKVIGKVRFGKDAYIAQGTIIRSHNDSVTIGNSSWVLENSVLIGTEQNPIKVGSKTVFGHKTVAIGAEIGDLCEIGNNTIFLPGSKIGNMCIFGEGTIVAKGMVIPSNSVVVGRPARVIRTLNDEDKKMIKKMRDNNILLDEFVENIFQYERGESTMTNLYEFNGKLPEVDDSVYIDNQAEITGDVVIGANSYIASGVRIIGNSHGPIKIGDNVIILENSVLHLLPDNELIIHDNVTIGPNSTIHGTIIGSNSIVEAGSIVCDYSIIGKNSLIKAGSLVKQRDEFEENNIIEGFPGKSIGKNEGQLGKPNWAIRKL
ncbi:MAG: DapH/DapD/GlmU-related protein [Senegalia sp. (in: firmicutes)]|uniref:DapH/DapD/GlmU-related protein n=3 Tax=Senegalia sp. (in: firmicutes) TaxID=1924098 RepID=UPI003F9B0CC6